MILTAAEITSILQETDALRRGHFSLTSGRHSDTYCQCARVFENPGTTLKLAAEAVERIPSDILTQITQVAAPAIGGLLFGFAVAAALDKPFIFAERKNGEMQLRRSFAVTLQGSVLVCEDVVTTGGSVQELINLVTEAGGNVGAVVSLIDRSADETRPDFTVPYFPLLQLNAPSWSAEQCELCAKQVPIDQPGSRSS